MKQKLLNSLRLRACMLVAVLCAGVSAAWGDDQTWSWTASSGALGSAIGSGTITSNDITWNYERTLISGTSYTGWTSGCIQLGKNGGVENLTLSTSNIPGTIKSVSVECSSYQGKHNVAITVGGMTYLKSTATASWTTVSAATGTGNSSGEIVISFTGGTRALYIKSITVVYEENTSSTTTLELSEPKDAQGNVVTTFYVNNDFYIYPTTNSTGAVSCTSSDPNVLKVDNPDYYLNPAYINPIKAHIYPKNEGTATLTFTVAADGDFEEVSKSVTITVVKIPTECQIIEPEGFNTDIASGETAGRLKGQLKNIYNVYNSQSENETVRALFSWSSSEPTVATIAEDGMVTLVGAGTTIITCNFAGDNQFEASSATKELTVTDSDAPEPITLWSEDFGSYSADDVPSGGTYAYVCGDGNGGSTTKVYEQNTAGGTSPELLVAKKNGTFTAVVPLNRASGQLTLKYKTNAKALYVSTTTEGVEGGGSFSTAGEHTVTFTGVTPDKTSITIVFTATTSDNVRLDDIELVGSAEVNAVEAPTFSINGGTYYTPQTVKLSCATEGAVIRYSFDGTSWNDYTAALTIDETKTIYAKAVKDGKESTVSSITVTIAEKNNVVFNIGNKTLAVGESYTVTFGTSSGKDVQSDGYVTLESNNAVVTIDNTKITADAVGTATITISVAEGDTYKVGTTTFTVTVPAPEGQTTAPTSAGTIFEEHFNDADGTGGNEKPGTIVENLWSGNIASSKFVSDNEGWTYPSNNKNPLGYVGYQCAKFGNGSNNGYATTPEITATEGNTYTLTFKAAPWATEVATMNVTAEGATISGISEDAMTAGQWNDFTATITTTASTFKLTFYASENRFFLDEVVITDPNAAAPTFSVTLNAKGYATYCNQYPLDFTNNEDVTAWALTGIEEKDGDVYKMNYTQITGKVKGGVGMLLKGTAGATVSLTSADSENVPDGNKFVGTLAPTFVGAGEVYGLKGDTFKKSQAGIVKPYKAFIPAENIPNLDEAKSFVFVFEDEATGVRTIETVSAEDAKAIFNLSGQRVNNAQKGIYIVNGKKVVIK